MIRTVVLKVMDRLAAHGARPSRERGTGIRHRSASPHVSALSIAVIETPFFGGLVTGVRSRPGLPVALIATSTTAIHLPSLAATTHVEDRFTKSATSLPHSLHERGSLLDPYGWRLAVSNLIGDAALRRASWHDRRVTVGSYRLRRDVAVTFVLSFTCMGLPACSSDTMGTSTGRCWCPCSCAFLAPQFSCPLTAPPSLSLTGPCEQNGAEVTPDAAPVPMISGTGAGTCHATFTLADGEEFSTDIEFTAQWTPCGNDPHGCGERFEPSESAWPIHNACADAGSPDAVADVPFRDGHD